MKKQSTELKEIFASCESDRGLITQIYEEFKILNTKRTKNPINKWANVLNRQFSKEKYKWPINT
jgi:hypothetical protein